MAELGTAATESNAGAAVVSHISWSLWLLHIAISISFYCSKSFDNIYVGFPPKTFQAKKLFALKHYLRHSRAERRTASAIYMYGCRQVCFQLNYTSSTEKTRPRGGTKESAEILSNAMQLSSSLTTGKNKRQCRVGRRTADGGRANPNRQRTTNVFHSLSPLKVLLLECSGK